VEQLGVGGGQLILRSPTLLRPKSDMMVSLDFEWGWRGSRRVWLSLVCGRDCERVEILVYNGELVEESGGQVGRS
jgi:hypothetical protein